MEVLDRRPWPARALDRIDAARGGALLLPFSWIYLGLSRVDRWLRPSRMLPPVPPSVGVGNLRVGGSGKTPVVEDLARRLRARGRKHPHVLARGYRAEGGGDEAGWLRARGHSVDLGADRRSSHAAATRAGADLILLDDSLQSRDRPTLQLVLVLEADLRRMPRPLPAGRAREGRAALARADALCIRVEGEWPPMGSRLRLLRGDGAGLPRFIFRLAPRAWVDSQGRECPLMPLPSPLAAGILALSGLARPESFEAELQPLLPDLRCALRFADHCQFGSREIAILRQAVDSSGAAAIVVPEKNRQRLLSVAPELAAWSLRSEVEWLEDPCEWIEGRLSQKK